MLKQSSIMHTYWFTSELTVKIKRLFNVMRRNPVSATSSVISCSMNRSTCQINRHYAVCLL